MAKAFHVTIVSPEQKIFEGEVSSLVAPSELGYLGILADHASLVANLVPGKITFKESSGASRTILSKGKGFLEVLKNNVVLLLDTIENLS